MGRRCSHKRASLGPQPGSRCAARRRARGPGEISRLRVQQTMPEPYHGPTVPAPVPAPEPEPAPQAWPPQTRAQPAPTLSPARVKYRTSPMRPQAPAPAPPPPSPPPSGPPPAYSAEPRKLSKTFWPLRGEEFDTVQPAPTNEKGFLGGKKAGMDSSSGDRDRKQSVWARNDQETANQRCLQEDREEEEQVALGAPSQFPGSQKRGQVRRGFGRFVDAFRAATHVWRRPPQGRTIA